MIGPDARRTPGELALHPVALVGLAALLLNDHLLKALAPGWWTGKLSDVAGLAFFPFLLVALTDVVRRRGHPGTRTAVVAACATALVFTAIKTSGPARELWTVAIGLLRYPVDAIAFGADRPVTVGVAPDASDVLAILACAAVVVVVRRRTRAAREPSPVPTVTVAGPR